MSSTSRSNRQLLGTIVYLVIYMVTIVWLQSVKGLEARDRMIHQADHPIVGSCDSNQEAISSTMDVNLDSSDLLLPPAKEIFEVDFDSSDVVVSLVTSGADSQLTVPYFLMSALAIGFVVL